MKIFWNTEPHLFVHTAKIIKKTQFQMLLFLFHLDGGDIGVCTSNFSCEAYEAILVRSDQIMLGQLVCSKIPISSFRAILKKKVGDFMN